jgi:hypothetical protein
VPIRGTLKICRTSATPEQHFLLFRREHALERGAHVLDRLVDDVVEPDVDALALRRRPRFAVGRTWKPITIAPAVVASSTSDSLIAPTPRWIDVDLDLGRGQLAERSRTAPAPSRPRRP